MKKTVMLPIDPAPEDRRFFTELARLEPSEDCELRILAAAGFDSGRREGRRQVRRGVLQVGLVAAMVGVGALVIFQGPESATGPRISPVETGSGTPIAPSPVPASGIGEDLPGAPGTAGEIDTEIESLEGELLELENLSELLPPGRETERREARRRIEAVRENLDRLRASLRKAPDDLHFTPEKPHGEGS